MDAFGAASLHGPEGLQAARKAGLCYASSPLFNPGQAWPTSEEGGNEPKKTPPAAEFGKLMAWMIGFRTVLNSEGEFLSTQAATKLAAEGEGSCSTQQRKRRRNTCIRGKSGVGPLEGGRRTIVLNASVADV